MWERSVALKKKCSKDKIWQSAREKIKNECTKKKTRIYLDSNLEFGFNKPMDKVRIECVICSERLANDSPAN